jgi:zinc protease
MYLLEGATIDPRRFSTVGGMMTDYTETTPAAMQALARKYLTPGSSWRLVILPEGQSLSAVMPAAPAGGR